MPTLEELKESSKNDADLQIFVMSQNFTDSQFGFTNEEKWQLLKTMDMPFTSSKENIHDGQSHGKIPDQFEGTKYSVEGISNSLSSQLEANADLDLSLDSTRRTTHRTKNSTSSIDQAVPSISLHNQFINDDNPFSVLVGLTNLFPSLVASALSQNSALYRAASIAAASLPPTYVDFSMQSNTNLAGEKQQSASSGISAVVSATVAAASAWWRINGLLPPLFQPNHEFTQVMTRASMSTQVHEDNSYFKENVSQTHKQNFQQIDHPKQFETNRTIQPCSALLDLSSSPETCESTEIERPPKSIKCTHSSISGMHDVPGKKKHDPSSCDSNTSPSCEAEKDAASNREAAKGIKEQGELGPFIFQDKSCTEGLKQVFI